MPGVARDRRAERRHLRWRRLLWAKPHGGATRSPRHRDAGRLGPHLLGRVRRRRLARAHPLRPVTERWPPQRQLGDPEPRGDDVARIGPASKPGRSADPDCIGACTSCSQHTSWVPGLRSPALDSRSCPPLRVFLDRTVPFNLTIRLADLGAPRPHRGKPADRPATGRPTVGGGVAVHIGAALEAERDGIKAAPTVGSHVAKARRWEADTSRAVRVVDQECPGPSPRRVDHRRRTAHFTSGWAVGGVALRPRFCRPPSRTGQETFVLIRLSGARRSRRVSATGMSPTSPSQAPVHLTHFAMWTAFPPSDYYWASVAMGPTPAGSLAL